MPNAVPALQAEVLITRSDDLAVVGIACAGAAERVGARDGGRVVVITEYAFFGARFVVDAVAPGQNDAGG